MGIFGRAEAEDARRPEVSAALEAEAAAMKWRRFMKNLGLEAEEPAGVAREDLGASLGGKAKRKEGIEDLARLYPRMVAGEEQPVGTAEIEGEPHRLRQRETMSM